MKTLNYGLIGCGMMGREHLNNVALLPGINIAAIYEPDEGMAAQALAIAPGAQMAGSVGELLAIEALDALVIASPNHCHAAQLAEIAASRPLPILVEKPLFTDPADAPAIAELNASYGAPIWVAMEYRYMPPIATMVDRVQAATGGPLMLSIREHRFPVLAESRQLEPVQQKLRWHSGGKMLPLLRSHAPDPKGRTGSGDGERWSGGQSQG